MVLRWKLSCLVLLFLGASLPTVGQDLPGGVVRVKPALTSEGGSHPKIVLQTVEGATSTATCLAIRYAEPHKKAPRPGVAHLFEHMQYRTEPNGKPGQLLLRNELLGNENRAWVRTDNILFSELVPASAGLDSLKLQLARLTGVPDDPEGLKLEIQTLKGEISTAEQAEEQGRRRVLESLGRQPQQEGDMQTIDSITLEELRSLLASLSLEDDLVIAIVGPHTEREVRQFLSSNLKVLATKRVTPREPAEPPSSPSSELTVTSPSGYQQSSLFFEASLEDSRVVTVARALLKMKSGAGFDIQLEREDQTLFRMDLRPSGNWEEVFADLSPEESQALFGRLSMDWLQHYESPINRAEMLALAHLRGEYPDGPVSIEEFPALLAEAKVFLGKAKAAAGSLSLLAASKAIPPAKFYTFKTQANRSPGAFSKQKLPNDLGVTLQKLEHWPTIAVSGYFRISPNLSATELRQLEAFLAGKDDLRMEYEIKPNGFFFHHWAPSQGAGELLRQSAAELKALSEKQIPLTIAPTESEIDEFFLGKSPVPDGSALKLSRLIRPKYGHLVVVGDFSEGSLDQGLRPAWSGWFGADDSRPAYSQAKAPEGPAVETPHRTVNLPPEAAPIVLIGFSGPTRHSPDFLAYNLALQTLAGRPNTSLLARLFNQEKLGVSSVKVFPLSSSLAGDSDQPSQIWLFALLLERSIEDPQAIVDAVQERLVDLSGKALLEADLQHTRSFLKSSLTLSSSTFSGRARLLAHSEFYRLSETYALDFAGLYDHLTPSLVREVCQKYFQNPKVRWLYFRPDSSQDPGKA